MTDVEAELARRLSAGYILESFAQELRALAAKHPDKSYRELEHLLLHPPVPEELYHWAPATARAAIAEDGLLPADPGGGRFGSEVLSQPVGVYGASNTEDWREPGFDLWAISTAGLPWNNDPGSGESWYCPQFVPPKKLRLLGRLFEASYHDLRRLPPRV